MALAVRHPEYALGFQDEVWVLSLILLDEVAKS